MLTFGPPCGSQDRMGSMAGVPSQIVAVTAVVVRGETILAMRRAPDAEAGAGLWETVSGRVEPGEEPLDAVAREIGEETGLEVLIDPRPVDAYAAQRAGSPMTVIVFRADWVSGEVRRSAEHDDHVWLTPEQFAQRTTLHRLAHAVHRAAACQ
jgi:8-oxo-dGTP pyrophosphatase MutT (NUDIX family)